MPPSKPFRKKPWQSVAQEAQLHRDLTISSLIPPTPKVPQNLPRNVLSLAATCLDENIISITDLPLQQILKSLTSGRLSATIVTRAYLQRAALSQSLVNCLTELLPERALARAQELDAYFKENGPIGPLHGLPISVKEHVGFKGLRTTTGYIAHWDNIAKEDAHILQVLQDAGAIFHCRTTVPQTMMHLETDSNLYGVTVNPYNSQLTAGGSSGGEGSLIALHGSCLGIGSDVGGSIRSPAANCGVWGFKPTAFRIPTDGWGYMMAAADSVESVLGPLSTSLFGLSLFMKTILDAEPWKTEPALVPIPWRNDITISRQPKIGILWHDGIVKPHPPITRALRMVTKRLQEVGVEVVEFPPYLHDEAWAILSSLYFTDGGEYDIETIKSSGEPWRPLSNWIIKENPCVKKLSTGELTYWMEEREAYRKEYALHWNKTGVDVLLCPVGPGVAPAHNTAKYWSYTSQWNLLDYPGAVFPVTKVDKTVDLSNAREGDVWLSGHDEDNWKLFDPEETQGCPVSLQLVGRRFEDEKVLKFLEFISDQMTLPVEGFLM
ncbi:amidase signature domain-containing protein [Dendryphion nanum]|uniref:amidase n=1 Tax=Dendryphion nanum TaxID=256645 RepID=A0A9P9IF64_9PLEO|nr:amidase signature domain-containing protein [Dendryphion nanum]